MSEMRALDLSEQWYDFLRLLKSRRWTIMTFMAVTVFVVLVGTSLQPPVYRATAVVMIDIETPNVLTVSTSRDDSTVGQSHYLTYADYYRTQLEVITSRHVAQKVFRNLKLGERLRYAEAKDGVNMLQEQVSVEPIKQTRLVKIHVEDSDPKQSARIANEFAFVFVEENIARSATAEAMNLMKNEYLKLQSKEAELSKRYKAKFPEMVRVRQQMDKLARVVEGELEKQLDANRLQDVTEAGDSKSLVDRLRESSTMGGLRPSNVRVQDLAVVPMKRSKPNTLLNLLLSLFLGVLGGVGAAVIEEAFDSTLKVPKDIEEDGRFVLFGYIPRIIGNGTLTEEISLLQDSRKRSQYVNLESDSEVAEAYRIIRTNLIYAAPQSDLNAMVVTSPGSGEGKTTIVSNLGIALAQIGLRVLLIDADLRKPCLHEMFECPKSPGLSEFLIDKASFKQVVHATEIPGLSVVTSGTRPPNPAELIGLERMREFLKQAKENFDRVILDAPPILPVTDAAVLAAMTKTVVAVAHSGKTPRQALQRMTSICTGMGAKVLGVILNNVAQYGIPAYGYGNHHRYQYPDIQKNNQPNPQTFYPLSNIFKRLFEANDKQSIRRKGGKVAKPVN